MKNISPLKNPLGRATLAAIRADRCYLVDKISHLERLIDESRFCFLSRPRRFGKSLLPDTMRDLFEGNQALFEGLHVYNRWDWRNTHPVVRLSFNSDYGAP